ncbi:MAG TPA: glycosyltransferase [Mycobacteriales bacterium]|nr:glycosyltransferase [Mycobacteriales bacterium]
MTQPPQPYSLTVAVVVKDRKDWMSRCLDAIDEQTGASFDIVVVDNGSVDGTYEMLLDRRSRCRHNLTVLRDDGTLGQIRNTALAAATGEVVAFTDSDCVPRPGWLAAGLAGFATGVAAVQGRTVPMREAHPWEATIQIESFDHRYETCNLFYDRSALLELGGFGETMPQFGEDMVAGWRLRQAGWSAVWAGDAVVEHEVTFPGLRWWLRRGLQYHCWPRLIREFPDARHHLYGRYFLNGRQVLVVAAAAGVVCSAVLPSPYPLLGVLPLLWRWRPVAFSRRGLRNSCYGILFDLAAFAGLLRGSVATGRLVL